MIGYTLRRLVQAVVVLVGLTVLVFVLEHIIPGNLARAILGPRASPGAIAAFDRAERARPPGRVAVPDVPLPCPARQPRVLLPAEPERRLARRPRAAERPHPRRHRARSWRSRSRSRSGSAQAVRRNRALDHLATGCSFLLYSMPSYWLGLLLIAGLAIGVHVFPPEAPQAASPAGVLADPRALVLPVDHSHPRQRCPVQPLHALGRHRHPRPGLRPGRPGKGPPGRVVLVRHVLRNSLVPVVTLLGLSLPAVLTTGLVVEYVFNFPGLGLTYFNAAVNADYPVELGITVIVGAATVLGSLLADLAYAVLDPRVRYG